MDNHQIEDKIFIKTMESVDNLAIQVAELNTTLREVVLEDIDRLKGRADRHRKELDALTAEISHLQSSKRFILKTLGLLGAIITTVVLPIVAIIVGIFF